MEFTFDLLLVLQVHVYIFTICARDKTANIPGAYYFPVLYGLCLQNAFYLLIVMELVSVCFR